MQKVNDRGAPEERFWKYVDKRGEDECWEWVGYKNKAGYGILSVGRIAKIANRVFYETKNGEIPKKFFMLHKCDNPPCCNPKHLFLGTRSDNMKDMVNKKRNFTPRLSGEQNGMSKLSKTEVLQIRKRYKTNKYTQAEIGNMFGVAHSTISAVIRHENWKEL